jgi:nickel-dependent lactate racemase
MVGNPLSTWGVTQGNPIWEEMHEVAKMTNPTCIVNVTVNKDQAITGIFAGDMDEAHAKGVEWIKSTVIQPVHTLFDIVITTNSGYPLDLNLAQALKGVSAARQIVKQGGSIIAVSECSNGVPDSHYKKILHETRSGQEILNRVTRAQNPQPEQWVAQTQAMIQMWADIYMYSSLPADEVKKAHIEPITSVEACLAKLIKKYGSQAAIAVLPEGPQTIPYLHEQK